MTLNEFSQIPDEKLSENISPNPVNNNSPKTNIQADIFNSAGNTKITEEPQLNQPLNTDPLQSEKPKGKLVLGKLISGKATTSIINIFVPSLVVFALKKFNYSANKNQLRLTKEEQEILAPVVQDCLDYVEVNFDNPFYALAFVATMIYGSKIMDIVPDLQKIKSNIVEDIAEDEKPTKNKMPYRSEPLEEEETIVRNDKPVTEEAKAVRDKINSTSIRKEQTRLIVEYIEEKAPSDLIEMFAIYGSVYPERNENYFRKWYENKYEAFPAHLRFLEASNTGEFDLQ